MKRTILSLALIIASGSIILITNNRCSGTKESAGNEQTEVIRTNVSSTGQAIEVIFQKGKTFNHPLIAIWTENLDGKYLETLYVSESIGKGIFRHADKSKGAWQAGPVRRPAALPYWSHQRGIWAADGLYTPASDSPMPDAVTGTTPSGNFSLQTRASKPSTAAFKIFFEINQSWDWNEYWTNNKYPDNIDYKTSSQPSLVYSAVIDPGSSVKEYGLKAVGHGHYAGLDGSLDQDLSTLTTALEIAKTIVVRIE